MSKHTIGTRNPQPSVLIDYEGFEKQLIFYTAQQKQVDTCKYVLLSVKKGLLELQATRVLPIVGQDVKHST